MLLHMSHQNTSVISRLADRYQWLIHLHSRQKTYIKHIAWVMLLPRYRPWLVSYQCTVKTRGDVGPMRSLKGTLLSDAPTSDKS